MVAADPRLAGAAERSLVATLKTLADAGYALGLIPTFSAEREPRRRFPSALRALLAAGGVKLIDPDVRCTCRLLLGHHLLPFMGVLSSPLRVEAERRIVRWDQPLADAAGGRLLHLPSLLKGLDEALGGGVALAPVDAGIAASLGAAVAPERIAPTLAPLVAEARYRSSRRAPPERILLVGDGWPQDQAALAAARQAMAAASIATDLDGGECQPADAVWVRPPHGLTGVLQPDLAEAVASGLPVLGPASYREALDDCLIACPPDPALAVEAIRSGAWEQAAVATARLGVSFQPDTFVQRVRDLMGDPRQRPPRLLLRRDLRPPWAAVFMSSNGVGIGHLIRGLAVARRLSPEVRPVFFTLSGAAHVAAKQGWAVETYQHVQHYGGDATSWRQALAGRLDDLVGFHRPRVFVFDGNVPYAALLDLRAAHPEVWFVWVRRGMWRSTHAAVARRPHPFDVVLTPGELAADYDAGATAQIEDALPTPPITYFDREELSGRAAARLELGINDGTTAVLLQLGAGNNFNMVTVRANLIDSLARRSGVRMFEARWPMSFVDQPDPRVVRLERFPLAHLLPGFDLVISACGYNSFHEILLARVPAVFVPNENLEMDTQERRALWAARQGLAASGSALQPFASVRAAEALLEGRERAALHARLSRLEFTNGAAEVADLIAELGSGRRSLASGGSLIRRAGP